MYNLTLSAERNLITVALLVAAVLIKVVSHDILNSVYDARPS